jgi:hypothetical protein
MRMLLAVALAVGLVQAAAPSSYEAVHDRGTRTKPALVRLGAAGFSFNDPVFGSRLWRVTDERTRPDAVGRSYRTPSATHQNAWSADASRFYVVSTDGTILPFAFDADTGRFSRLTALRFYLEPQFSYLDGSRIYGSVNTSGSTLHTIDQYDFDTGAYTRLLDLEALVPDLRGTYVGGITSSGGPVERIAAFFGGSSQDRHHYVVVFDRADPAKRLLLDTSGSRLGGFRLKKPLGFHLHHAAIDRSGRYVALYPSGADLAAPRKAAQVYVWDTTTGVITPLFETDARAAGHDALGYGIAVNQDCCTTTTWDAAQWQIRSLAAPLVTRDLIAPVIEPKEVSLADHPTWNNARPDALVPFITATYRYGSPAAEWRTWDDEILAVQTDNKGGGAEVWRLAHHRSDVRNDDSPDRIGFWYTPRPNVSRDGRWVLFTSNWEKTLGQDPAGPAGERARQDVFLLRLDGRE